MGGSGGSSVLNGVDPSALAYPHGPAGPGRGTVEAPPLAESRAYCNPHRLRRNLLVFVLFVAASVRQLTDHSFLVESLSEKYADPAAEAPHDAARPVLPLREWDRMLFGIFTYDSPNERDLRNAARETHLSHFLRHTHVNMGTYVQESPGPAFIESHNISRANVLGPDTICSLGSLMKNWTLMMDAGSCRIVYTFVVGGGSIGAGDDPDLMRTKAGSMMSKTTNMYTANVRRAVSNTTRAGAMAKTRCLYGDPDCGGTDVRRWTVDAPEFNASASFRQEIRRHGDITLLSIPENHELGKTDTWMTYAAMLSRARPELQLGFVGKIDSDNLVKWPGYLNWLGMMHRVDVDESPFLYGGYAISKLVCSQRVYGRKCAGPDFIGLWFVAGAFAYFSVPLAQRVYMDGTTLERKREVWMVGEDVQMGNMAYSDPGVLPLILNHRDGRGAEYISVHCYNEPKCLRDEYRRIYEKGDGEAAAEGAAAAAEEGEK